MCSYENRLIFMPTALDVRPHFPTGVAEKKKLWLDSDSIPSCKSVELQSLPLALSISSGPTLAKNVTWEETILIQPGLECRAHFLLGKLCHKIYRAT